MAAAIFVGGLIRWILVALERCGAARNGPERGGLLSSGFIAGVSLMGVLIALLVIGLDKFPWMRTLARRAQASGSSGVALLRLHAGRGCR